LETWSKKWRVSGEARKTIGFPRCFPIASTSEWFSEWDFPSDLPDETTSDFFLPDETTSEWDFPHDFSGKTSPSLAEIAHKIHRSTHIQNVMTQCVTPT
jgi:hypothetical protein